MSLHLAGATRGLRLACGLLNRSLARLPLPCALLRALLRRERLLSLHLAGAARGLCLTCGLTRSLARLPLPCALLRA
ncbi:MAG: hypothetical protein RRY69_06535, partial [Oscillospiraceae bacterium]